MSIQQLSTTSVKLLSANNRPVRRAQARQRVEARGRVASGLAAPRARALVGLVQVPVVVAVRFVDLRCDKSELIAVYWTAIFRLTY